MTSIPKQVKIKNVSEESTDNCMETEVKSGQENK